MEKYAVIDIGSLKIKLLVAEISDQEDFSILRKESILTCLGDGLKGDIHKVLDKHVDESVGALREYRKICLSEGVSKIKVVATESLRKSDNKDYIIGRFEKAIGAKIEVITQRREAEVLFSAVCENLQYQGEFGMVDMGGGSIQLVIGKVGDKKSIIREVFYIPLGVYKLQQKFISDNSKEGKATDKELVDMRNYIEKVISGFDFGLDSPIPLLYGSSNILDLCKFLGFDLKRSNLGGKHKYKVSIDEFIGFLDVIKDMSHQEREDKFPFEYGYMWGVQVAFYNIYFLAKVFRVNYVVPSNVNIAEGYIREFL